MCYPQYNPTHCVMSRSKDKGNSDITGNLCMCIQMRQDTCVIYLTLPDPTFVTTIVPYNM